MKKPITTLLGASLLLFCFSFINPPAHYGIKKEAARCYGYSPCNACSNCSACKYCSAGGTCGVCAKPVKSGSSKKPSGSDSTPGDGQCRATTQKGTRCSRKASGGSYCWQHNK